MTKRESYRLSNAANTVAARKAAAAAKKNKRTRRGQVDDLEIIEMNAQRALEEPWPEDRDCMGAECLYLASEVRKLRAVAKAARAVQRIYIRTMAFPMGEDLGEAKFKALWAALRASARKAAK